MSENNTSFKKIEALFKINEEIKINIKLLYVFDNNVILVTNEDKVFCSGSNSHGVLGFGHQNPVEQFTINLELSNKQLIDFKNSLFHTIALNSFGKLYCWGYRSFLGNGRRGNKIYKPKVNEYLVDEIIIDYCCGWGHTIVLTSNEMVYAWGDNIKGQIGNKCNGDVVSRPYKVNKFNGEKVIAISCGYSHTMALTDKGCVYSWGDNSYGQLGINSETYEENEPKKIQIEDAIKKISCGHKHSLLLSFEGKIYVFGCNYYKQWGLATHKEKQSNSIKLNYSEKIIEIASYYRNDTSVVLSENGLYYVWGKCAKEEGINEPEETQYECFEDIFAEFLGITVKSLKYLSHTVNNFIPNGKYAKNWKEIAPVGKGSYGSVFKVEHKLIEKTIYAIKKIPIEEENNSIKELINSPLMLTFNSDHLVRYYDVWYENDLNLINGFRDYSEKYSIYIQMELCDKTLSTINEEIKKDPKLFANNSLTILGYYVLSEMFGEIFKGLSYLHSKSIIHRDLNPYNILVKMQTNGNCIKIADFNLAVVHEINKLHTLDRGHARYVAPEMQKNGNYDTKADIFFLGVILEELFDIDFNRSTNEFSNMRSKYECLKNLIERMTLRIPQNRPNCDQILEERDKWAINESEFNFEEELDFLLGISIENRSYVQNIVISKLSHIVEIFRLSF